MHLETDAVLIAVNLCPANSIFNVISSVSCPLVSKCDILKSKCKIFVSTVEHTDSNTMTEKGWMDGWMDG